MDRDFVLEARTFRRQSAAALVAPDLDGWIVLSSFCPEIPEGEYSKRRSVKIVVDCSGSMGGDSISQARSALESMLDGLRDDDLFDIVAFGSTQRAMFGRETPVNHTTLGQARHFVRGLDADMGGTEIGAALDTAYGIRGAQGLSRDLLLITDGEVWDNGEIITHAQTSGHRIFTVGVDSAVGEAFVRGLADATGGACELVAPGEGMDARIHRHFQRMYAEPTESATVRWPLPARQSEPEPIEAVYGGDTLHVFAWFQEKPEGAVSLDVTLADGRVIEHEAEICTLEEASMTRLACEEAPSSTLARLGAARCLVGLEDDNTVIELAVRHQLMSKLTNYIVTRVRAEGEKADDLPKILKVPQTLAAGWHGLGTVQAFEDSMTFPEYLVSELSRDSSLDIAEAFNMRRTSKIDFHRSMSIDALVPEPDHKHVEGLARPAEPAGPTSPTELAEALSTQTAHPLPTLDDLKAYGVPETILAMLRDLVDRGEDENTVVVVMLYLLLESRSGDALERQVRRQILKTFKTVKPNESVLDAVKHVVDGWLRDDYRHSLLSNFGEVDRQEDFLDAAPHFSPAD